MTLKALRAELKKLNVDGMLIPRSDSFCGEEVPPSEERLAFISGFTGSAGMGLVTQNRAVLFSDERYALQAPNETSDEWECFTKADDKPSAWLKANMAGKIIGFDPWLLAVDASVFTTGEVTLKPLAYNPIDKIWADRPSPQLSQAEPLGDEYTGLTRREKISLITEQMLDSDALVISEPAGLCWLLNIRGRDLAYTPLILAFGILTKEGEVIVFAHENRFAACPHENMRFADLAEMKEILKNFKKVMIDPHACPYAIKEMIKGEVILKQSPITLAKAKKTPAELKASYEAHRLDGVAMCRFLAWFDDTIKTRSVTEIEVADKLAALRSEGDEFICPSFATICGGGAHGAIIHHRAKAHTEIPKNSLCLIDSGAQYLGATTDITRTIATGDSPPPHMAEAFTQVLQAHIALATCRFPLGTNGIALDSITRAPLWRGGKDYAHGTGHGVGAGLSVHEAPASISKRGTHPIEEGMILSNEPGYYVAGEYGIRIENLIAIKKDSKAGMLAPETLTLVPIDKRLIRAHALTETELAWLNNYHQRIKDELMPLIKDEKTKAWLEAATEPITYL